MTDDHTPTNDQIDDPDKLSQKTRVRELLERRKEVIDARDAAKEAAIFGEASERSALLFYRGKLESLIMDLWTKFKSSSSDSSDDDDIDGEYYLNKVEIGKITIPVPDELPTNKDDGLAPGASAPDPETVTIKGLSWFLKNDAAVSAEYSTRTFNNGPGTEYVTATQIVPWRILDEAVLLCIGFMDEIGIDADTAEQELSTFGFEETESEDEDEA